jgi:hypothetical protein
VESDVPAIILDNRTLLPVRALSEALGSDVQWNGETYTATVVPRPALDWAETASKVRLHLTGVKQLTGPNVGDASLAGRLELSVQIVNDGDKEQQVDLNNLHLMAGGGAAGSGTTRKAFVLPHVLEVSGNRAPAAGTTMVTLAKGERVTAKLGYDLPMADGVKTSDLQLVLVNASGGTEAALRLTITITIDCRQRPCTITIEIRF